MKKFFLIGLGLGLISAFLLFRSVFAPNISKSDLSASDSNIDKEFNLIFVGDIMLDRGVLRQINKAGSTSLTTGGDFKFPFLKIAEELNKADLTIGNLEGPIVSDPKLTPINTMLFNFDSRVLEGLKFASFDILSLANNHTSNRGASEVDETRQYLGSAGIQYFGDPIGCEEDDILVKDNLVFIGLNKTFPINCSDEDIVRLVKDVKADNPDKLIIISIHWGEEYQDIANKRQQDLAHVMVDNGADLIIGHHPHVIQNNEQYKGKWIYYSLGNFVFDQNFSEETMEGMMLKVKISARGGSAIGGENGKVESVEPVRIRINSVFQPYMP